VWLLTSCWGFGPFWVRRSGLAWLSSYPLDVPFGPKAVIRPQSARCPFCVRSGHSWLVAPISAKRGGQPVPYTYLGRLKYIQHDNEVEKPVYFDWQLMDWPAPRAVLETMQLRLEGARPRGRITTARERGARRRQSNGSKGVADHVGHALPALGSFRHCAYLSPKRSQAQGQLPRHQ